MILSTVYIVYIIYKRPAKLLKLILNILVFEFFVLTVNLVTFTLAIYDKWGIFTNFEARNRLGWIIIGSNIGLGFFMTIMRIYDSI